MDFDKVLRKRTSIRDYTDKKINYEKILNAIEASTLAPSPGNLSILKYIIIENPITIKKIAKACRQNFISKAPFLVVVVSNSKQCERFYYDRAERYVRQTAGASIENFLLKITDMKLASCWIGAYSDLMIKNILGIPDEKNLTIEAILPIAYPSKIIKPKKRPKPELNNVVYFENWKNKYKNPPKKIEL